MSFHKNNILIKGAVVMKNTKKKVALVIAVVFILSALCFPLVAFNSKDPSLNGLDGLLENYFQYRKETILIANNEKNNDREHVNTKLSEKVANTEDERIIGIRNYLNECNLKINKVDATYEILDSDFSDNSIHVFVYESIDFDWTFTDTNTRIKSGYGTEHDIFIDTKTSIITDDLFYEKDFSGIATTNRTYIYTIAEEPKVNDINPIDISNFKSNSRSYNVNSAVSYALSYSSSSSGTTSYNPKYKNWAGYGGDCANFVSQCLYAGGLTMTTSGSYVWYYDDAGTPCTNPTHGPNASGSWNSHTCTADDSASSSWTGCSSQRAALVNLYGCSLYGPNYYTNSSVYLGNLLYTNSGGHVYICTDASSTIRCYTCHTTNRLNWPFDIESTSAYILRP